MTGKMNRAFPVNRVPAGRVCTAEKLNFQAEACGCPHYITSDNFRCRFPGGTTGCTSSDGNLLDFTRGSLHIQFRCTELVSISSQAVLPGKTASGGGGDNMGGVMLLPGSHQGNFHFRTELCQVIGQVRVLQKIQHQVRFNFLRQKLPGIVDDRRKIIVNRNNVYLESIATIFSDTGNLGFTSWFCWKTIMFIDSLSISNGNVPLTYPWSNNLLQWRIEVFYESVPVCAQWFRRRDPPDASIRFCPSRIYLYQVSIRFFQSPRSSSDRKSGRYFPDW